MMAITIMMTKMKKNISDCLCEQPVLHPVSPNFALCAVCWRKARNVSAKNVLVVFERLLRVMSDGACLIEDL